MTYPEIKREEIEKLKKYVGKEIELSIYTAPTLPNPSDTILSKIREGVVPPDWDWERFGYVGYPSYTFGTTKYIKTILLAVLGNKKEEKIFPEYIVGKDNEGLKIYSLCPELSINTVSADGKKELLWSRAAFTNEEIHLIKEISEQEFEELKKKLVQIIP